MDPYPLVFDPIFKRKIWGGRALETRLSKKLPPDDPIGESWEIADLEEDQSVVAAGPARGKTLGTLVREWDGDLLGEAGLFEQRFPLLIKFLDAHQTLSVQVHPDEATARRLGGRVRIKNEAWYVLYASSQGCIYRGVREGVDAAVLRRAIDEKRVESVIQRIPVRTGQCYYLPSGTLHALGAGVVVAEVQTPSDITYRVYDWDRVDASTGKTRELHVEQALGCISYNTSPISEEQVQHTASVWTTVTSLVRCDSFTIDRVRMVEGANQEIPVDRCFVIWMMLDGRCSISCKGYEAPWTLNAGQTVLIPAGIKQPRVLAERASMWLEVSIPLKSSLAGLDHLSLESLRAMQSGASGLVPLNVPEEPDNRPG